MERIIAMILFPFDTARACRNFHNGLASVPSAFVDDPASLRFLFNVELASLFVRVAMLLILHVVVVRADRRYLAQCRAKQRSPDIFGDPWIASLHPFDKMVHSW